MGPLRTGSLESLRERNRLRVIDALRTRGAISRADIARQTGLSRSTVSSLVADLQADGAGRRARDRRRRRHRRAGRAPAVLLSLDRVGRRRRSASTSATTHVRVAVADLSCTILAERDAELDVDHAAEDALDTAAELVRSCSTRPASTATA